MSIADEIKEAMKVAEITAYEIEQKTGLSRSMMSRFFTGKVAISLKSLNILLDHLGYELTIKRKRGGIQDKATRKK
jgi:transcriptional regulator with XRE-family HTH domain